MGIYWKLFFTFFKVGFFTFGGGYAMLPLLQREMLSRGWASKKEILNYYAFSQITPGIIAVNTSTFIGYKLGKWKGAVCAMLGIVMPSVIVITLFALGLQQFWSHPLVQSSFASIQLMIPALILPIVLRMIKERATSVLGIFLMVLAFLLVFCGFSSMIILFICGLVSLMCFARRGRR